MLTLYVFHCETSAMMLIQNSIFFEGSTTPCKTSTLFQRPPPLVKKVFLETPSRNTPDLAIEIFLLDPIL